LPVVEAMASPRTVTAATAAALSGALATGVRSDATRRIDRAVRRRVHPRRSSAVRSSATVVSYLAGPHIHLLASAILGAIIRLRRGEGGTAPIIASLASLALDNGVRLVVHQRRPPRAGKHRGRSRFGFPSGHTTAATAIAVATASEFAGELSAVEDSLLWLAVLTVAVSVGWSRLYLDEHWIDDVVGGWLAGVAVGLGAASVPRI